MQNEEKRARTNEEELDLFAELLEPCVEILADKQVADAWQKKKILGVKAAIQNHKAAVIEILAKTEGIPIDEYKVNLFALPVKLLALFNRPEVSSLFILQGQKKDGAGSGSATVNIEDGVH